MGRSLKSVHVVAARSNTYGTQRTLPNEIWSLQHLGVTVNHGGNDVLPVQSQEPVMQLVLRARCQNFEIRQFHPSDWRKQFVAQAMFRVLDLRAIFQCLIWVYY